MKKLVLTLVLGVFAFGASGYSSIPAITESDCIDEAWDAGTEAFEEAGGIANRWAGLYAFIATETYYAENCL